MRDTIDGRMITLCVCIIICPLQDLLVTVFENGQLMNEYALEDIRERAELPIVRERRPKK